MAEKKTDRIMKEVITPDLGMDHPVPIAEIFVEVGQVVKKEDPLLSLESEKAVMDLPSPFEGTIREILVQADQEISSGSVLMKIELAESSSQDSEQTEERVSEDSAQKEPETNKENKTEKKALETEENVSVAEPSGDAPPSQSKGTASSASSETETVAMGGAKSHASPSVRLYARELGVDLAQVRGSGPKNRVKKEDVQAYVKQFLAGGTGAVTSGSGLPASPFVDPSQFGSVREEKLTGIQKISGAHLHASWVNIPHVTHHEKADITELEEWRKTLNAREKTGRKYTTLAFVVKALTGALKEFPRFNSVLAPQRDSLLIREYVNVAIAVDTPKGLLVPVINETDKKGIGQIADEIIELARLGREGKLRPENLKGASISISNLGGIGGTSFTPIINPPEVAILGLSRAVMEPVWSGTDFSPRLMLPMSLSYDHRVIDGAMAARFAAYLAETLTDLKMILL